MSLYKMVELDTLIQQAKTVRCGSDDYPILSMTMHDGLVFQDDKFKKIIASKDRSDYKVVKRNQLVISFPIDEGVLAAQRIVDAGIVSPAYSIWDIDQEKILPEFLEYALRCDRALSYYKAKLRGSTARRRSLPTPTLLAFTVPLPGVSEQQFVLDVIHKAKKIIDNRSEEIQQLDNLVKARFVEMFGDYIKEGGKPLSELATITGGLTKNSKRNTFDLKMPYLRVANVFFNRLDLNEILEIGIREEEIEKTLLQTGDLLFVEGNGSIEQIGRVAIWDGSISPILHQNHLIKARFRGRTITPEFALYYFMSQEGRQQIISKSVSTSGLNTLSVNKIGSLILPMPPVALQEQFAEFVKQTDKSKVVESIHRMNVLFNITLNGGNRYDIRANEF